MLPNNLDILYIAIEERQRQVRQHYQQSLGLPTPAGPIRRAIGRFLVWSGRHVGGAEGVGGAIGAAAIPVPAPVVAFSDRYPRVDLDVAA